MKGELTMARTDDRIYEFACHEANYSLTNMLRGYRVRSSDPQISNAVPVPALKSARKSGDWQEGTS